MKAQIITVVWEADFGATLVTKVAYHVDGRDLATTLALEKIVPVAEAKGVADRLEHLGEHTTPTTRIKLHTLEV